MIRVALSSSVPEQTPLGQIKTGAASDHASSPPLSYFSRQPGPSAGALPGLAESRAALTPHCWWPVTYRGDSPRFLDSRDFYWMVKRGSAELGFCSQPLFYSTLE